MSDLKLGTVITLNNQPYAITYSQHIKVARGSATLRTKLKNLITGAALEKSFSGGDKVEAADVTRRQANFLYEQSGTYTFMDQENFEQYELTDSSLESLTMYLKADQKVDVLLFNSKPVAIELPKKITLKVTSAPPGVKGDTANAPQKTVTLETGLEVRVPMFIKDGDAITINTENGEYVERAQA